MEQCSPFGWIYYNEEEAMMGEMSKLILQSKMELEATVIATQDEIMRKEEELIHMKYLLMMTIKERDEAQSELQKLMFEKLVFQKQLQLKHPENPLKAATVAAATATATAAVSLSNANTNTNTNTTTNCFSSSSSESEESSIINSPQGGVNSPITLHQPPPLPPQIAAKLATNHLPLPEKGKLLKAVMEAGPLLQTLLLAGPLPQWQHPPPRLESIEIPPVTINTSNSPRKRVLGNFDSLISSPKYQRVV